MHVQDICVCSCVRPASLDLPWRVTCRRCASRTASCSAVLLAQRRLVTRSRQQQLTLLETKECLTSTFCENTPVHVSCHAVNTFSQRCTSGALWSQQGQLLLPGVCDRTALRLSCSSSRLPKMADAIKGMPRSLACCLGHSRLSLGFL